MNLKGYDTGDSINWKEGSYTRVIRVLKILNGMRTFMGLKELNETLLYEEEKYKSASNEIKRKKEIYIL